MTDRPKSSVKRKLFISLFSFIILLAVLGALSSRILHWGSTSYLSNLGVDAKIGQVRLDLFDGRLLIENFSTSSPEQRLAFERFSVQWLWSGLLDENVTVESIELSGLRLDVLADNQQLTNIGPIDLSQFSSETASAADNQPPESATPWQVAVGPVKFTDIEVCYRDQRAGLNHCGQWQTLDLNTTVTADSSGKTAVSGDITLEAMKLSEGISLSQLTVTELIFEANQLNWQAIGLQDLAYEPNQAKVAAVDIKGGQFDIATLSGQIDQIDVSKVKGAHEQFGIDLGDLQLKGLETSQGNKLSFSSWILSQLSLAENGKDMLYLSHLSARDTHLLAQEKQLQLDKLMLGALNVKQLSSRGEFDDFLSLQQLNIEQLSANESAQTIKGLALTGLGLMQDLNAQSKSMLLTLSAAELDNISHTQQIDVGTVNLHGLLVNAIGQKDQGINLANWFKAEPENNLDDASEISDKAETPAISPQPAKKITLKALNIDGNSTINFTEDSLGKPIKHQLSEIVLNLVGVELNSAGKPAEIQLSAKVDQSGELSLKGLITPDKDNLSGALAGDLNYLSLPQFSPYSARFIGYRIDQGQLNVGFKIDLADSQIDSNFELLLNKFEIGNLQQHEKSAVNEELGVPLSTALNLIRDSDDNIELSIPVKGDLNNPDFSVSGVVETVTLKALKTAVIYTYSPLGLLSVANDIVDLATALRFKPVVFAPHETVLTEEAMKRLDKTAGVLKDKNKVSLVLCANATKADLAPQTPFDDGLISQLTAKAELRQSAVKNYLVEKHKIAEHRLLTCNVKLSNKADAKPQVSISL